MSPIKGLSERTRLPRLGKIHLGIQVPVLVQGKPKLNANGEPVMRPKATDYFVFTEDVREEMEAIYGVEPKELPILIASDDPEEWASQWYRCYGRTFGLTCRGDGETCRRLIDTKTGAMANRTTETSEWKEGMPCTGRECPDYKDKRIGCSESMNLQFMLPDAPGLGIWQIDTSSINSILNINSNAAAIADVAEKVGRTIAFVPIKLTFEPKEVTNPDDHKKKTVHVLNMRVAVKLQEVINLIAKPMGGLLLPAPGDAVPDDLALELPDADDDIPDAAIARQDHAEEDAAEAAETSQDGPQVVEGQKVEQPIKPPHVPAQEKATPQATPVPQATKAPPAETATSNKAVLDAGLLPGMPNAGDMGLSTIADRALLKKLALDHGLDLGVCYQWLVDAATKQGKKAPAWEQVGRHAIYTLSLMVLKNSKITQKESNNVNQGPESEPTNTADDAGRAGVNPDAGDIAGGPADGDDGGAATGDGDPGPGDDDADGDESGWDELARERDARRAEADGS